MKVSEQREHGERDCKVQIGLCSCCLHMREIKSDRGSIFYLCELSATDPSFPKYPRLPVLRCAGYSPSVPTQGNAIG